jgi:hypothetical protein
MRIGMYIHPSRSFANRLNQEIDLVDPPSLSTSPERIVASSRKSPRDRAAGPSRGAGRKILEAAIATAILFVALMLGLVVWNIYGTLKTQNGLTAVAYDEWNAAKADHDVVVSVAEQCRLETAKFTHKLTVPAPLLTIVPTESRGTAPVNDRLPGAETSKVEVETPSYMLAAIILSNEIGRSRVDVAGNKTRDNAWTQIIEWALVLIGAITTVLISIKSLTAERSSVFTAIGIAGIIFSTLGTSLAAINSFYSPRSIYERDERTLSNLRSLHLQLVNGLTREPDLCQSWDNRGQDWRFVRIKSLADRYVVIASAVETGQLATDGEGMADLGGTGTGAVGAAIGTSAPSRNLASP